MAKVILKYQKNKKIHLIHGAITVNVDYRGAASNYEYRGS